MLKYIRYFLIILFKLISKTPIGWIMFHLVRHFRRYARNTVYNYVIQNKVYLKRLLERPLIKVPGHFLINGKETFCYKIDSYHNSEGGYIKYRHITSIEYYFALWFIWIWIDDDSNHDTMDKGFIEKIISGKHMSFLHESWKEKLKAIKFKRHGNSFDMGDNMDEEFHWLGSTLWNIRNTAYNFNYMFEECLPSNKNFFYHRITNKYIDWHFGFIPYGSRAGRMVWFTEDIDKV